MSISDATELAILDLVYRATTWANYAINATTSPEASIGFALHTVVTSLADTDTQATSEIGYTSYQRVAVARTSGGFNAPSAGQITLVANVDFPAGTGGSGTVQSFSTGKSPYTAGSATTFLWSGAVAPTIATGSGVTPRLTAAGSHIDLD